MLTILKAKIGMGAYMGLGKASQEWCYLGLAWKDRKMSTCPEKQGIETQSKGNSKDKDTKI